MEHQVGFTALLQTMHDDSISTAMVHTIKTTVKELIENYSGSGNYTISDSLSELQASKSNAHNSTILTEITATTSRFSKEVHANLCWASGEQSLLWSHY